MCCYPREPGGDILESMRKTTIAIDDGLVTRAGAVLGTRGLKATIQRALEEVVARDARQRFADRLRTMEGLDLDNRELMEQAWQ
jgi:Arc/MetJ family transcription regulator